jgi:hypothetical protein
MQENTESEKPGNFLENEELIPEVAETAPSETPKLTESGPEFEEEVEFLPSVEKKISGAGNFLENEELIPEVAETAPSETPKLTESGSEFEEVEFLPSVEKKISGAGKVFLFLILVLGGSGSYLYFNNLISPEILNLVFPKSSPSKPLALMTETPAFIKEVAEIPLPTKIVEAPVVESIESLEIPETHISGNVAEPKPPAHISGSNFNQMVIEKNFSETKSIEEAQPEEQVEEEPREVENLEKTDPILVQKITEEAEFIQESVTEPVAEKISPTEPASLLLQVPQRSKAAQAYLDFIESSVLKIGELIGVGFNWGWDYLKKKFA